VCITYIQTIVTCVLRQAPGKMDVGWWTAALYKLCAPSLTQGTGHPVAFLLTSLH
jgi:hypothetical protein